MERVSVVLRDFKLGPSTCWVSYLGRVHVHVLETPTGLRDALLVAVAPRSLKLKVVSEAALRADMPVGIVRLSGQSVPAEQIRATLGLFARRRGPTQLPRDLRKSLQIRVDSQEDPREIATWLLAEVNHRGHGSLLLERLLDET